MSGNMLINPMYKGERRYGRRSPQQGREIIICPVPALVTPELWQKAKDTLAAHVCRPKKTARFYLLRGVMKCGACGRSYVGSRLQGQDLLPLHRSSSPPGHARHLSGPRSKGPDHRSQGVGGGRSVFFWNPLPRLWLASP